MQPTRASLEFRTHRGAGIAHVRAHKTVHLHVCTSHTCTHPRGCVHTPIQLPPPFIRSPGQALQPQRPDTPHPPTLAEPGPTKRYPAPTQTPLGWRWAPPTEFSGELFLGTTQSQPPSSSAAASLCDLESHLASRSLNFLICQMGGSVEEGPAETWLGRAGCPAAAAPSRGLSRALRLSPPTPDPGRRLRTHQPSRRPQPACAALGGGGRP